VSRTTWNQFRPFVTHRKGCKLSIFREQISQMRRREAAGAFQVVSVALDLMPRSSQIAFVIANKLRVVGFGSGGTIENSPRFNAGS
jgi:hypothetical protein